MNKIGNQFRQARKRAGLKQSDFKGIADRRTLGRFERGETNLHTDILIKALEKMGLTFGEFMNAIDASSENLVLSVPCYDWESLRLKRRKVSCYEYFEKGAPDHAIAAIMPDESMQSAKSDSIPKDALIIIDPIKTAYENDIVVISVNKEIYCRRVKGGYYLPENSEYSPFKNGRIIGRVIAVSWSIYL